MSDAAREDALLPCPFCGAAAVLTDTGGGWVSARCQMLPYGPQCGAQQQQTTNRKAAVALWNKRVSAHEEAA